MKMKVSTRIVLTVYLAVVILLAAFLFCSMLGVIDQGILSHAVATILDGGVGFKVLYAVVFIAMIAVGFMLLFFGMRKETPRTVRISQFDNGGIQITVRAIEELAERYVRGDKNVKGQHTRVISYGDYIDILTEISVLPDINIPAVTLALKDGLAENISQVTGITVHQVNVSVMSIKDHIKPQA